MNGTQTGQTGQWTSGKVDYNGAQTFISANAVEPSGSSLRREIGHLQKQVEELHNVITDVCGRLSDVAPERPQEARVSITAAPTRSPLAGQVQAANSTLAHAIERLQALHNQIDL